MTKITFKPGDRVHFDADRDNYWPRDEDDTPGWATVVDIEKIPAPLRAVGGARTPVEWDEPLDGEDGPAPFTMAITACLRPAEGAGEPDPRSNA